MSEHPETPEFEDGDVLELAVLPLRNTVLFPQVVVPLAVGRAKSVKLIEEAVQNERPMVPDADDSMRTASVVAGSYPPDCTLPAASKKVTSRVKVKPSRGSPKIPVVRCPRATPGFRTSARTWDIDRPRRNTSTSMWLRGVAEG